MRCGGRFLSSALRVRASGKLALRTRRVMNVSHEAGVTLLPLSLHVHRAVFAKSDTLPRYVSAKNCNQSQFEHAKDFSNIVKAR